MGCRHFGEGRRPARNGAARSVLVERRFDGLDCLDGTALDRSGAESPLLDGFHCLFVQATGQAADERDLGWKTRLRVVITADGKASRVGNRLRGADKNRPVAKIWSRRDFRSMLSRKWIPTKSLSLRTACARDGVS